MGDLEDFDDMIDNDDNGDFQNFALDSFPQFGDWRYIDCPPPSYCLSQGSYAAEVRERARSTSMRARFVDMFSHGGSIRLPIPLDINLFGRRRSCELGLSGEHDHEFVPSLRRGRSSATVVLDPFSGVILWGDERGGPAPGGVDFSRAFWVRLACSDLDFWQVPLGCVLGTEILDVACDLLSSSDFNAIKNFLVGGRPRRGGLGGRPSLRRSDANVGPEAGRSSPFYHRRLSQAPVEVQVRARGRP